MSVKIAVSIDATKFNKYLQDSPANFARAINNTISKAALSVEREAKIDSPVDTGRLRSTISTVLIPLQATIQPHVNYAIFVHEGTRFMQSRPFMYTGAERAEKEFGGFLKDELDKIQ